MLEYPKIKSDGVLKFFYLDRRKRLTGQMGSIPFIGKCGACGDDSWR
jgi:hypothetical protein